MKRFLFIGHDATRTGAPFVLLHLLRWIRENHPECEVDLLLLSGGELEQEYRKVADVYVLPKIANIGFLKTNIRRIRNKLGIASASYLPHFRVDYDVVVGNTVVTLRYLKLFKQKAFWTINWVHELDNTVNIYYTQAEFKALSRYVDDYIVGSQAVKEMLNRYSIDKPIHLIYEFSPKRPNINIDAADVRKNLGISARAFLVGGCGTIEARKGVDLFLNVAELLLAKHNDFCFLWIGRKNVASTPYYLQIIGEIERLGLRDKILIVESDESPEQFLAALDVFVLPSREDPFPLVCLEAANLGKPIICFADAGGMPEFVGSDAGEVVPFGDVKALCNRLEYFYSDLAARKRAGEIARIKSDGDFSLERSCRQLFTILSEN